MRKQFVKTISKLFYLDKKIVMLLGDIGGYGFRDIFKKFPKRIFNIGILVDKSINI